jgi:hypothetical protein
LEQILERAQAVMGGQADGGGGAVRSDEVEGARVDVHILPWNQKWPPPKIDLDAQCR